MMYDLQYDETALEDIRKIKKSGNKPLFKKLTKILHELEDHPRTGTGQVEHLKHFLFEETWSRRLNKEYRIIYEIHDDVVVVKILSVLGHYGAK